MAQPAFRSRHPSHPQRELLVGVRGALFRLHKTLVDAERAAWERMQGPMSPNQFLGALLEDPALAWLRPFSGLIVRIDDALHSRDTPLSPDAARAFVAEVDALVRPDRGDRLRELRESDPVVHAAHTDLAGRLAAGDPPG